MRCIICSNDGDHDVQDGIDENQNKNVIILLMHHPLFSFRFFINRFFAKSQHQTSIDHLDIKKKHFKLHFSKNSLNDLGGHRGQLTERMIAMPTIKMIKVL